MWRISQDEHGQCFMYFDPRREWPMTSPLTGGETRFILDALVSVSALRTDERQGELFEAAKDGVGTPTTILSSGRGSN